MYVAIPHVVLAAVTGGTSSGVFNLHNFTLKRPILCRADQASTNRIFANIIPFLRVTFGIANEVIKNPRRQKGFNFPSGENDVAAAVSAAGSFPSVPPVT